MTHTLLSPATAWQQMIKIPRCCRFLEDPLWQHPLSHPFVPSRPWIFRHRHCKSGYFWCHFALHWWLHHGLHHGLARPRWLHLHFSLLWCLWFRCHSMHRLHAPCRWGVPHEWLFRIKAPSAPDSPDKTSLVRCGRCSHTAYPLWIPCHKAWCFCLRAPCLSFYHSRWAPLSWYWDAFSWVLLRNCSSMEVSAMPGQALPLSALLHNPFLQAHVWEAHSRYPHHRSLS